ncbi:alanine racemase [Rothia halotolerans]|uniref:alanine racemase n=1 Tax=Rothia halotolerans TaxID=405770 RepID=UPI00101CF33C|nr:alanine racemase [Rothia halotolerans]
MPSCSPAPRRGPDPAAGSGRAPAQDPVSVPDSASLSKPATSPAGTSAPSPSAPEPPPAPLPERAAVIDLDALAHNVRRLRRLVAPARLIAVVKADAYGHGASAVARAALAAGADLLGVAHVREALRLREEGIGGTVLAWLHTSSTDFAAALEHDVELGVSGWELEPIAAAAEGSGRTARVHLKIDTGLGRNGSTAQRWPDLVERARALEERGLVEVVGIFTHLAVADEPERPETREQLERFDDAVARARAAGLRPALLHVANSPATLALLLTDGAAPQGAAPYYDAVRVGLALYGLSPISGVPPEDFGLRPVMTLRTTVDAVKEVPAGQGVSYGLAYRTERPTTLALIPLGYADGVPRVATGGPVRIHPSGAPARTYPVVGRIAMDQLVVDLGEPGLSDPALGYLHAPAVLFGAGEEPSADDWAEAAGTINYEIVTRISPRVERVTAGGAEREDGTGHD